MAYMRCACHQALPGRAERLWYWLLDRVPLRCRTWPVLRRYYWQPEEMEAIRQRVARWERLGMFGPERREEETP